MPQACTDTEAFVAEAGPAAVLKLMIARDGDHAGNEITVLRLAGGDGCARLLRADPDRGALLLERLGRSVYELGLPLARRPRDARHRRPHSGIAHSRTAARPPRP